MKYHRTLALPDGEPLVLRSAEPGDARAVLDIIRISTGQTDFLLSYPDEITVDVEAERALLSERLASERALQLCAELGGAIVGIASLAPLGDKDKIRHRAEFGVTVDAPHWGRGVGSALTRACIECAGPSGFEQLELAVVGDNRRALALYERFGFVEYGRNPRAFRTRDGRCQTLVLMRLELTGNGGR